MGLVRWRWNGPWKAILLTTRARAVWSAAIVTAGRRTAGGWWHREGTEAPGVLGQPLIPWPGEQIAESGAIVEALAEGCIAVGGLGDDCTNLA